jgi:hypothetical protein
MTRFRLISCAAFMAVSLLAAPALSQSATYLAGVVQEQPTYIPPVQVVARTEIPAMSGGVNDFSGIASRDGRDVYLLSDHGFIARVQINRGYGQSITGIDVRQVALLLDDRGAPLSGPWRDAEGLSIAANGRIYVSFEGYDRVVSYPRLGAAADDMGEHRDFPRLSAGSGLESVAVARDGSVYAIPERAARATYGFPSYRWREGEGWSGSFRLPQDGSFLPVGADFGPDGLLYVLERARAGGGYRSQVRRFGINGRAISRPEVVMRSDPGQFGNLEGLAVFRDWSGRIRLLMVEDDELGRGTSEIVDVVLNR